MSDPRDLDFLALAADSLNRSATRRISLEFDRRRIDQLSHSIAMRDGQAGIGYALLALVQEVAALRETVDQAAESVREAVSDSTAAEDITGALEDIRIELAYIGDQGQARVGLLGCLRAWQYARRARRIAPLTIEDPQADQAEDTDSGCEVAA